MSVEFRDVNNPPPGGFVYETHGERVSGPSFVAIAPRVRALMEKYGIPGIAEEEVARFMCPRLRDAGRYCKGAAVPVAHVVPKDAIANSLPYCSRTVVAFDEIERRMRMCHDCPKHRRDWCPTCSGHVSRMMTAFGGRRTKLPEDSVSGVCQCAKAYEIAVASVEYGGDEPVWEGAPGTCWRFTGV